MISNNINSRFYSQISNNSTGKRPHKISRKEFVSKSTSLFQTTVLSIKWLLIRQNRPFNTDDLSAFVSWFVWSNLIWLVVGTTTFASLVVLTIKQLDGSSNNSLLDKLLLKLLFKFDSSKLLVESENIIPDFQGGVISLRGVSMKLKDQQDGNFACTIDAEKIDLTLSFQKWYHGKGLINDVSIDGVKGLISSNIDPSISPDDKQYLTKILKTFLVTPDYEFGTIKLQNVDIEYMSGNLAKPINLEIFNLELPKLRLKWFLLDVLKPKVCSGSVNDSLFTLHQKQIQFRKPSPSAPLYDLANLKVTNDDSNTMTRVQVHEIDLQNNPFLAQKFNWLDGKVNVICDINLPNESHFNVNDFLNQMKETVGKDLMGLDIESFKTNDTFSKFQEFAKSVPKYLAFPIPRDREAFDRLFGYNLFDDDVSLGNHLALSSKHETDVTDKTGNHNEQDKSLNEVQQLNPMFTMKSSSHNKYVFFDLKIQFLNCTAKLPNELPISPKSNQPYISVDNLRPIIALINNKPSNNSFFSNKRTASILLLSEVTSLSHISQPNAVYDDTLSQDKQFTLTSSMIFNLDKMYGKISVGETDLVDQIVSDLYDDLAKNLNYELNTRYFERYGKYYNFNISHLLSALTKTNVDHSSDSLFGITSDGSLKYGLLVLLGLGAIF